MLDAIFIYMLLLPEGRAGEGWELPKKQRLYGSRWALDVRVLYDLERVKVGAVKADCGKEIPVSEW